jgi:hypothetical protein
MKHEIETDRELSQLAARGRTETTGVNSDAGWLVLCCGLGPTAVRERDHAGGTRTQSGISRDEFLRAYRES